MNPSYISWSFSYCLYELVLTRIKREDTNQSTCSSNTGYVLQEEEKSVYDKIIIIKIYFNSIDSSSTYLYDEFIEYPIPPHIVRFKENPDLLLERKESSLFGKKKNIEKRCT